MTQKRKPSLLPEERGKTATQPAQRTMPLREPQPRPPKRKRGCASILLLLLAMVLSVTLVGVTAVILYNPELIGLDQTSDLALTEIGFVNTASALQLTADSLNATAVFNAQQAFDVESTLSAFNIAGTQSARDAIATQTSIAISNAQQATQSALEFQGTQAEFDRAATQSQLNYQSTQAFLNQNATAVALGFATAPANSGSGDSAQLTVSPPPLFDETFTQGLDSGLWVLSAPTDWRLGDRADMLTQRNGAWLLTQRADFLNYALDVTFQPPVIAESYQYILLNMSEANGGIGLELYFSGGNLSAVSLYQIAYSQINASAFLTTQQRTLLQGVVTNTPIGETVNVQVDVRNGRIGIFINQIAIMDITLTTPLSTGAVGVYFSQNTRIERIAILP